MQNLFKCWDKIACRLKAAHTVFLFFDYDGTLAPIVDMPEMAVMDPTIRTGLIKLSERPGRTVGIISGRGLEDIRKMVGIDNLVYAGNHGLEVGGRGINYVNPGASETRKVMQVIAKSLQLKLVNVEGALLEDKVFSLSVHYRLCRREAIQQVKGIVDRETKQYRDENVVKVTFGKKVLEVRPHVDWHKGRIVELLMDKCAQGPRTSALVWYIGDDLTDEDAFKAVNKMDGITVVVGAGNPLTEAKYMIPSQNDVSAFMAKLESI